jgi:hypothetical protein
MRVLALAQSRAVCALSAEHVFPENTSNLGRKDGNRLRTWVCATMAAWLGARTTAISTRLYWSGSNQVKLGIWKCPSECIKTIHCPTSAYKPLQECFFLASDPIQFYPIPSHYNNNTARLHIRQDHDCTIPLFKLDLSWWRKGRTGEQTRPVQAAGTTHRTVRYIRYGTALRCVLWNPRTRRGWGNQADWERTPFGAESRLNCCSAMSECTPRWTTTTLHPFMQKKRCIRCNDFFFGL